MDQQPIMFSKIGRYISNKILKYSQTKGSKKGAGHASFSHKSVRDSFQQHSFDMEGGKQVKEDPLSSSEGPHTRLNPRRESRRHRSKDYIFQPCVGHYKINYSQVEKSPRKYDFNRSVPHFYNQKYQCNVVTSASKQYPDSFENKSLGFKELNRMTSREEIKGSIRRAHENPHENRFNSKEDMNSIDRAKCGVDLKTMSPRDDIFCTKTQISTNSPEYYVNFEVTKQRLDSHIIPFERQTERTGENFHCKAGISDSFATAKENVDVKSVLWKKMLSRKKSGMFPSYMDKTINSRLALNELNLQTFEMNCKQLKAYPQVSGIYKKHTERKKLVFIEEINN